MGGIGSGAAWWARGRIVGFDGFSMVKGKRRAKFVVGVGFVVTRLRGGHGKDGSEGF